VRQMIGVLSVGLFLAGGSAAQAQQTVPLERDPLIQFRLVHEEPGPDRQSVEYEDDMVHVGREHLFSDADLLSVEPFSPNPGDLGFQIELKPEIVDRVASSMTSATGMRLALIIDGEIRAISVIRDAIGWRLVVAPLSLSEEEATRLTELVRARWPRGDPQR